MSLPASTVKLLKAMPLFSALEEPALRRLIACCRVLKARSGEALFEAGDPADRFFVILSGRVKIYQTSSRGDEQILHLYGPGHAFGEAAMWSGGNLPASAQAVEPSELFIVSRMALRTAAAQDPDLLFGMLAGMSAKLREFARLIEELSLKEVPARLAGVLLAEARQAGVNPFPLRQTKRELAAQIGTVPETLSRAFAKLRAAGLVEVRGASVRIKDPKRLEGLSSGR